ncbi:uncharacterized protein Z518_05939 [Rhinocladiella mackenziei CBS 650.93]|uniref:t-SNARE coiled-coil homology domain-containing protein n=1 Tax=Rhinocladiella mackenziei CBS 650.93 TaxID=1442369 RepID=A0A0D2FSH7_9EURO|nr:uncharacterized protein Z518_05939 [Rhinocladiella mackenziei CBS 650.93]KIX05067.1 hypothetical protein Z518_05939 [Rhinocladiella mackenziei CBS 650.93]
MVNVQNLLGPKPDLNRLSQSYQNVAEEVGKFSNLPPFDADNAILNALRQLGDKFDTLDRETGKRFDRLDKKVGNLDKRVDDIDKRVGDIDKKVGDIDKKVDDIRSSVKATDHNGASRAQNAFLTKCSDPLSEFVNPSTNEAIQGFPATSEEIPKMSAAVLNSVLRDLGLALTGDRSQKEIRLRQYIGLTPEPA